MSNQSAADSYQRDADNWGAIAVASFQAMGKRFKASRAAGGMQSILTQTADGSAEGVGIEIYSKSTGKKEGAVVLKDKKPEYIFLMTLAVSYSEKPAAAASMALCFNANQKVSPSHPKKLLPRQGFFMPYGWAE